MGNDSAANTTHDLEEILEFIKKFKREHGGTSPTIREIGRGCDISSTSVVSYNLNRMESKGMIQRPMIGRSRISRHIIIPGESWENTQNDSSRVAINRNLLADVVQCLGRVEGDHCQSMLERLKEAIHD